MSICPSYIGARRLRVTRLDHCGRPVYGDCSTGISDGFVSVEFDPEIQEGEDYTLRNAAGELCVSERGPDALQWINVSIEFCNVDPELWQIMNPTWKTVTNARGEVTGFRIGEKFSDEQGFALEVWPKAAGQTALCDDDAPDDAQPNGYFLLPYVIGGAPEGWTLEDGTATFTLNGRTKAGSLWGRGPYNITHDANGNPSPLLEPIESGSNGGDPDHFHADIVTIAPPSSSCGCQALEAMAPGAIDGEITTDPDQPNRACFTVSGSPGRRVTIDWGDESDTVNSRVGREECHIYTSTGTYTVTVSDIDDAEKSNSYDVTIDDVPQLDDPTIEVSPSSGTAPLGVTLSVDNHENGQVTIDWGDESDPETVDGNDNEGDGDQPAEHPHQYTDPGIYTITVTAVADDRAEATTEVEVTDPAPNVTAEPTSGAAPLEVTLTADNHGNGPVDLDWGEGETETNLGDGEATSTHTYNEPGTYQVEVTSQENSSHATTVEIEVIDDTQNPVLTVDPTEGEAPLEVTASVDNHGAGPVSLDWGDESEAVEVADGESATHTYEMAGEHTVTATSQANEEAQGTATVTVTEPEPEPENPALTVDPTEGEAPLEVTATVDNHGNGPVSLTWGDESDAVEVEDGASATHTYETAGEYTVTATSAADESASITQGVTVTDPEPEPEPENPVLTVDPTEGEAPLQVTATVDNHGNGPVNLAWGEGEAVEVADGESATHTYETAGEHTVTATSAADESASTTQDVTVTDPEPEPEALELTVDPTEGVIDQTAFEVVVDNHGEGEVTIDWGDGSEVATNPGDGSETSSHTYIEAGTFTITATDADNADRSDVQEVTVTAE